MPETIPPPPMPSKKTRKSLFTKLKQWSGSVSVIITLLSVVAGIWKTIAYIDELHDTIGSNKAAVQEIVAANREAHSHLESRISTVASAVREQRDRDQEVITQLRIAVAALQAAQGVRAGRMTYGGVQGDQVAAAETSRPPSARARRAQAERAEEDAEEALERATRAQTTANDPLSALEGL